MNGTIFIGYASNCDNRPFHGWLFAYDAATLAQTGVFVSTPNGGDGGFWMSGAGFAADPNGYATFLAERGAEQMPNPPIDMPDWIQDTRS